MEKGDDPYEILGVPYDASESEVKKAYRKAALKYHPDKQTTDEDKERAHDIFAKLSAAYDTLSDPVKRYDWKQANEGKMKRSTSSVSSGSGSSARQPPNAPPPPPVRKNSSQPTPPQSRNKAPPPVRGGGSGRGRGGPPPPRGGSGRGPPPPGRGGSGRGLPPPGRGVGGGSGSHGAPPPPPSSSSNRKASLGTSGTPKTPTGGRKKRVSAPIPTGSSLSPKMSPKRHSMNSSSHSQGSRSSSGAPPPIKRGQYRDPFDIFDKVMKEEYGDDYKDADIWKDSKGVIGLAKLNPFSSSSKRRESSKKEFKKLDVNRDKTLSKNELRKYIETHNELWTVLGLRLNLPVKQCMGIATDVAFQLATGRGERKPLNNQYHDGDDRELTEEEFTHFHKKYVLDDKGAHEFFLRTIFSAFDDNGDGVLQKAELDNFLDVFYEAGGVFQGKMKLPPKKELRRVVVTRLDKNKDGVLSFHEIRDLLEVAAVVTSNNTDDGDGKK